MIRLFVALALPDDAASQLLAIQSGVPGARWQERDQLHLTLRFIGEVDRRDAERIDDALVAIFASRFAVQIKGVGEFGGKHPRALWAGVAPNNALMHLQRRIETALQNIGLPAEGRRYTPHVTLARLRGTAPRLLTDYLTDHTLFAATPFEADEFILYSSKTTSHGSIYVPERYYSLR